ncbi:MAG: sensor histidine kinase, partial [Bdellovibrionales bacterium]
MIGLMTAKTDGTILDCNDYVLNLLGYSREEMNKGELNWRDLTPPEYHATGESASQSLKTTDSITPFEKEYVRRDGTRVPVMVGAARLADGVVVVFVLDICERKRGEQALEGRVSERTLELRAIAERLQQSQQFLDSVIENLPIMVFVKDARDLRFLRLNRAGEELLGYSREVLMGKNDYDFFPKEQADAFCEKDRLVLEGRKVVDIAEEQLSTKYGLRYLHTKKIPVLDGNGNPIYLLGISEDITERKAAELQRLHLLQEQAGRAEAERSAEQLRFLSQTGAALNESLDLKSRLDAFAQMVISQLGDWCEVDLVDESMTKLEEVVISHRDPLKREWAGNFRSNHSLNWKSSIGVANVIRTGKPELHALLSPEIIDSINDPVRKEALMNLGIHSAIIVPLQSYGRVIGALSICNSEDKRSFTERDLSLVMDLAKRASFAIENSRLYRQAQEASQAKSAFLANMSHEIRTPLGAMLGFAELLRDDSMNEQQTEYLATLLRNGQQLLRIVDEVLDLSKVESDRIQ